MIDKKQFQYIWNVIYEMFQKGEDINKIKFVLSEKISPYMEINENNINYFDENIEVEVNPFLRFNRILSGIIDVNIKKDYEEIRKTVFNVMLHILSQIDLYEGMSKRVIINRKIVKEFEEGKFGKEIRKLINYFTETEKISVANSVYDLYKCSNSMHIFEEAIKNVFEDSIVYNNKISEDKLIIFINDKGNERNKNKFRLLRKLFLPMGLKTRVYWENHFGVIGVRETLKINNTSVF